LPDRSFLKSLSWGIPIVLAVAGLWYGPMIYRHGWLFVDQFIIQHHFARFVTNKYHHPQPFYFYLPILALLVLPWTIVLVAAFVSARRWQWKEKTGLDRMKVFALCWIALPLIFFSFSRSKIPGYILPILPAAALLIGERIGCFLRVNRGDVVVRLTGILFLVVAAAGASYALRVRIPVAWIVMALLLPVGVGFLALVRPALRQALFLLFALTPIAVSGIALRPAGRIAARESVRDLIQSATARGYGNVPVVGLHTVERSAEFYAAGRLMYGADGEPIKLEGAFQAAEAARRAGGVVLCFVPVEYESQLTTHEKVQTEIIGDDGRVSLLLVRAR